MSSDGLIRVMLVDDHPLVRRGIREVLEDAGGFLVVGEAADGLEAVSAAERSRPDVVIMDVIMPERDGVDACRDIMDLLPETKVLMLTASPEEAVRRAFALLRSGNWPGSGLRALPANEREVLTLFASGRSYAQIAKARENSTVTVRNVIYRVQDKLGLKTKQEIVVWAVRNGLLDEPPEG